MNRVDAPPHSEWNHRKHWPAGSSAAARRHLPVGGLGVRPVFDCWGRLPALNMGIAVPYIQSGTSEIRARLQSWSEMLECHQIEREETGEV